MNLNEAKLAKELAEHFRTYSYTILNGALYPFIPLATEDSMVVKIIKKRNGIAFSEVTVPDVDGYKGTIKALEAKIKELEKENKSLNVLLEDQTSSEPEFIDEESVSITKKRRGK